MVTETRREAALRPDHGATCHVGPGVFGTDPTVGTDTFGRHLRRDWLSAGGISNRGTLNISPDDFNPERIRVDTDFNISAPSIHDANVGDGHVTTIADTEVPKFDHAEVPVLPQPTEEITPQFLGRASTTGVNGRVAFYDTDGDFMGEVEMGVLADSVTFTSDGSKLVVANEGR